jgi:DNA-directed RNA polymerase subunit beta
MPVPSPNLLDGPIGSLLSPAPAMQPLEQEEEHREFGDVATTRRNIYNDVLTAAQGIQPIQNTRHTLRLANVNYADDNNYRKRDQKNAILGGKSQGRRLRGTWELSDNETGDVVDSRQQVLATIPHFTDRGTFIHNGTEYSLRNQQRLRPGVYTRRKDNGEIEAHANILPGQGLSHRYFLDPEKGVFHMRIGQAKLPVLPLLKAMGATPKQLQEAWGRDLYAANYAKDEASALQKLKERLLKPEELEETGETSREALVRKFAEMKLDPEVTRRTLGKPYEGLNLDAILDITKKLVAVSKGETDVDDRDALAYQSFLGPEDLLAERFSKDHGNVRRQLLWKASAKGHLRNMPSSPLKAQAEAALLHSGLGQALEEINPAEILDKQYSISRLGEGGIPSLEAIPEEARNVQPSHLNYMDSLRTPESFKAGVDLYMARSSRKGRNGKIYTKFLDKKGEEVWKTPQEVNELVVTFPGTMNLKSARIPAMVNGRESWVRKEEVDLQVPNMSDSFSPLANLVPLMSQVKGQRVSMSARMQTQALPLIGGEAPLVQGAIPGSNETKSYEEEYGTKMGALHAQQGGKVMNVDDDSIMVKYDDGTTEEHDIYNNFPFNRKTYIHQTPTVQPGERFESGSLLARSNFTDETGATSLGRNARVAYTSWGGLNFEDANVISEGFAKKMSSEHMYQNELEIDDDTKFGKGNYVGLFPGKFDKKMLAKMDKRGVILPGTEVQYGDPLILAARGRQTADNKVHKKGQKGYADASIIWDHHDSGIVTDVVDGKKGPVVLVKATSPMQIGDKLSGRYGDKGVISAIIPDAQMPHDKEGQPFEVLLNPNGIISRTNPAQKTELALGKLAAAQGRPIRVEDFQDKDYTKWAMEELRKNGMSLLDDIVDPNRDSKIKNVHTGNRFFMKLHHTAESKGQARGGGAYTQEDSPAKGGASGSKRISLMDTNALLSHGATETLRDVGSIRGQRNEDYWLQFMQGHNPQAPKVPMVYKKFVNQLKAAGINVVREGTQTNVMALTDKDVDVLAGERNLLNSNGVDWKNGLRPRKGGLFDKSMTGGHNGTRWAAIKLADPLPNPVMEEPIRRMLNLTKKEFEGVISGEHKLEKYGSGSKAIVDALENVNIDKEIDLSRGKIKMGSKSERDQAIRRLGYLKSAKKGGLHPSDWVLKRAPVLPPSFRPVSMMSNDMPLVNDSNYLYKELMEANDNLSTMKKELGEEGAGAERLAVYHAFKAVTGLGDPISQKSRDKNVRGVLKQVFGSSPKFGTVQRKLISTNVDNVGRAVITPNPDFDMDTVGLPEDKAFDVYSKFVARRFKRQGMPLTQALQQIKNRTPLARKMLIEEMDHRPVFINRAPVLHKYGIMAFKPKLVKGDTMQISPLIVKGFNADFDGDAMNFHVPTSEEARKEAAEKLLPSRSLLSLTDFKTPMHMPGQEYVGGLWHATKSKSKRPKKIFNTQADAKAAYERGDISLDDQVQILR